MGLPNRMANQKEVIMKNLIIIPFLSAALIFSACSDSGQKNTPSGIENLWSTQMTEEERDFACMGYNISSKEAYIASAVGAGATPSEAQIVYDFMQEVC